MTDAEKLILRGLHIMMRTTFAPNNPAKQAEHMVQLQQDIGPWFVDYVRAMIDEREAAGNTIEGREGEYGN